MATGVMQINNGGSLGRIPGVAGIVQAGVKTHQGTDHEGSGGLFFDGFQVPRNCSARERTVRPLEGAERAA